MFNCDFQVQPIRQTSFSLSPQVWAGDLLLYNLAWAQLPEDSRTMLTSFKNIGREVGASHSMNLQIGGLASDKWKIQWTVLRMEIWQWPVATVKVCKIRPGPDHSLFPIETRTKNKQILSRNSDKNTDTEQNKQQSYNKQPRLQTQTRLHTMGLAMESGNKSFLKEAFQGVVHAIRRWVGLQRYLPLFQVQLTASLATGMMQSNDVGSFRKLSLCMCSKPRSTEQHLLCVHFPAVDTQWRHAPSPLRSAFNKHHKKNLPRWRRNII